MEAFEPDWKMGALEVVGRCVPVWRGGGGGWSQRLLEVWVVLTCSKE